MKVKKGRKRENRAVKPDEPPMTSMIDIIFQLLVFFILTLQIQSVEGKLVNQIPKEHGLGPGTAMEKMEVRIILCCEEGPRHEKNKGKHESRLEKIEQTDRTHTQSGKHPAHLVLNDTCTAWVARNRVGILYKTWVCKKDHVEERGRDARKRLAANAELYGKIAAKTKEVYDAAASKQARENRPPVILDIDSAVPYEHIIGVINALKDVGIHNVEFVGNPRVSRYYGSGQEGQFNTYRSQEK